MKKSQLNAISKSYSTKRNDELLHIIDAKGLTEEYKTSKYASPITFLSNYKTAEELAVAKINRNKIATERRNLCKSYGVRTLADVIEIEQLKLDNLIAENLKNGTFRTTRAGNVFDIEKNTIVDTEYILKR